MTETDMTDYAELREEKAATPHNELIAQLLDSRVPKSEREHAAAREIFKLLAERDELMAELERERMRLVACGVAALANTPDSASNARSNIHPEYLSASFHDVAAAVDREMALRKERDELMAGREGEG